MCICTLSAYYCNIKASQYCTSQTLIKTGHNFKVFILTKLFCIFENHYAVSINSKLQLSKSVRSEQDPRLLSRDGVHHHQQQIKADIVRYLRKAQQTPIAILFSPLTILAEKAFRARTG